MLSFIDARQKVIQVIAAMRPQPSRETIDLARAAGRVLAGRVAADRDYPPFDRSTRDGFALRAAAASAARRCGGWARSRRAADSTAPWRPVNACRS